MNRAAFGKERVVSTRRWRKLAGIVPYEDVELLEALEDKKDIEELLIRANQTEAIASLRKLKMDMPRLMRLGKMK